jgi:RNA polymerase sigma factor (sigma-70 family)
MIDIVNIGKHKAKYNDKHQIQFEHLDFYLTLAKKNIAKFADSICQGSAKKMLQSEDAIANVANGIMMADWRWDKNRTGPVTGRSKTQYSYRNQCAIWSIQSYITRQYGKKNIKRNKQLSLDQSYDDLTLQNIISNDKHDSVLDAMIAKENKKHLNEDIYILLNSDILSSRQSEYIRMYYFEGMTLEAIGKKFNITREAVRQAMNKAYRMLREVLNHS